NDASSIALAMGSGPGDTAADYFQSLGLSRIDLVVLTHYHEDHAGGIPELLERLEVALLVLE
ncbi:MBL fold metallo-hydrolase, partial [Escherichia coli]|uniref:MBL fold metallo-hydrolase n=1 Tax=Escherichia coli TaxID=562 RepID=UPI0019543499